MSEKEIAPSINKGENFGKHLSESALTYADPLSVPEMVCGATRFLCATVCATLPLPEDERRILELQLLRGISHEVGKILKKAKTNE